jgi:hypothetical protein
MSDESLRWLWGTVLYIAESSESEGKIYDNRFGTSRPTGVGSRLIMEGLMSGSLGTMVWER